MTSTILGLAALTAAAILAAVWLADLAARRTHRDDLPPTLRRVMDVREREGVAPWRTRR